MLKGMRFLLVVLFAACSAACGDKGTIPTTTTNSTYSPSAPKGGQMGGAIQNAPLPLATKDISATTVSTVAGTAGSAGATNGVGSAARFNIVTGVTTDGKGNFYVTDFGNHTIRKIDATGNVTTIAGIAGSPGSNTVVFDSSGNQVVVSGASALSAGSALFNNPSGITTDGNGNLYVADYNNSTIRRINIANDATSTVTVLTIAGSPGVNASVDATTGTDARFNHPTDVTTDGVNLYVTDSNNLTIRKISLTDPKYPVTTIAGSQGAAGANPPVGAAPVSGPNARFQFPARITTDGTNLYVTDFIKNTINMIDANGKVSTIAGTAGVTGAADGDGAAASFSNINGITSDGTNLYVTDSNNHTVRKLVLLPSGIWRVTTIAGAVGTTGSTDGAGSAARFKFPIGITTDGNALYVTDSNNYTIRKIQ